VLAVAVALAGGAWAEREQSSNDAAQSTAQRYVELIATGGKGDIRELWELSASDSPGAFRTAVAVLLDAEERIEVVSVGDVEKAPDDGVVLPDAAQLEDLVQVDIRYRLDGEEHTWPIVLGKLAGESGTDAYDWRVVTPLAGSVAWEQPAVTQVAGDAYLSGVRQVRRPLLFGPDETVQPLFPAIYRAQTRLAPYYRSAEELVTVTAGDPVAPPDFQLAPTELTQDRIRAMVIRAFTHCGGVRSYLCPATDIADDAGIDVDSARRWWRGFVGEPHIRVDADGISLKGELSFVSRGRSGTLRFAGTGQYFIDNQSWKPVLSPTGFDLREVRR
jgi:hypothetical protein